MKNKRTISVVSSLVLAFFAFVYSEKEDFFTLEQFGGQAWYLPADGRLQEGRAYPLLTYTPYSVDNGIVKGLPLEGKNYTKITAQSTADFFPSDIVDKSFCGLFAHQNPAKPNYDRVDEFYPQELGSRYAKVVHRFDNRNVLVDFEFNGGNLEQPRSIENGKGYFFYDNSTAWQALRKAVTNRTNRKKEIRLKGHAQNDFLQTLYVIPEYQTWQFQPVDCKIWSGEKNFPALKIGFEDYYQHEHTFGKAVVKQDRALFRLPGGQYDHNLIVNVLLMPPHRTVLEASTYMRTVFTWRKAAGVTALVGARQLAEERFIQAGKGLTDETFITWNFSSISGGGRLNNEKGVLQDIAEFGYVLCKDYEQRGPNFTAMNGNGGNFLVVEDADLFFHPQESVNPTSRHLKVKVNASRAAYTNFPLTVQQNAHNYLPYTFEIDGKGNFFQVFALGGSNRTTVLSIDGGASVFTFLANVQGVRAGNPGEFVGYWEFAYNANEKFLWDWRHGHNALPGRTASNLIAYEAIPEKGKRYVISRDYLINESFDELTNAANAELATVNRNGQTASRNPKKGEMYSNAVRTAVAWTTVAQKYANDLQAEKDVPMNGRPLALQPGDKFRIPAFAGSSHNPNEVYTVQRKDRGLFPALPAEFVGIRDRKNWAFNFSNAQSYRFFWCQLDKDLPNTIGLTFEIEMVHSSAESLLNGKARDAVFTYKGISRMGPSPGRPNARNANGQSGYGVENTLSESRFVAGEPLGHLCYSQVELTEWYRNVNWNNGFYRQNTNSGRGLERYAIKNREGKSMQVNHLARYSKGKTFINCTGGPLGQYTDRLNDFQVRTAILEFHGTNLPNKNKAKMRLYNSPEVRTQGVREPEFFLEMYPNDKGAPAMPLACKRVLEALNVYTD